MERSDSRRLNILAEGHCAEPAVMSDVFVVKKSDSRLTAEDVTDIHRDFVVRPHVEEAIFPVGPLLVPVYLQLHFITVTAGVVRSDAPEPREVQDCGHDFHLSRFLSF
ncbi:hypothetical protein [Streptomyces sp. A244]|uniref:hypothetical protein n=1 Tax=Streptomyces sp. A244 TaxID=2137016 RepID=UPI0011B22CCD|nr:hypothetical protein [Streptomyces sp. A244]